MTDTTTIPASAQPTAPAAPAAPAEPAPIGYPAVTPAQEAPFFALPGRWNPLALAAFAGAFIAPVVGIVFGHLALRDLRWNGERGETLARCGVVLGYVFSALLVAAGVVAIVGMAQHGFGSGPRLGNGGYLGGNGFGSGNGGTGNGFGQFPGGGAGQGGTGN